MAVDLTGQRFGTLVVIRKTPERRHGHVMWECKCDCGGIALVRTSSLVSGATQSCGCHKGGVKDLTGQRFGRLTVIRDRGQRKNKAVVWKCRCDCGNVAYVRAGCLKSGNTVSCGCKRREFFATEYKRK